MYDRTLVISVLPDNFFYNIKVVIKFIILLYIIHTQLEKFYSNFEMDTHRPRKIFIGYFTDSDLIFVLNIIFFKWHN